MTTVKLRFTYWCTWGSDASASSDAKMLVGKDAAEARFAHVVQLHAASPEKVSLAIVVPLQVFSWLLSSEQQAKVKTICSDIALTNKRASPSGGSNATSKKKDAKDAKAVVAALFKK